MTEEKQIILGKKLQIEQAETNLRIQNKALSVTLGQFQNEEKTKNKITEILQEALRVVDKLCLQLFRGKSINFFLSNLKDFPLFSEDFDSQKNDDVLFWIIKKSLSGFERLFLLNSEKFRLLEEISNYSEQMTNMKNVFGVISDAFKNSKNALASLEPIVSKMISNEELIHYKTKMQEKTMISIFSKATRQDFKEHFDNFINNLYQIASLSVKSF